MPNRFEVTKAAETESPPPPADHVDEEATVTGKLLPEKQGELR